MEACPLFKDIKISWRTIDSSRKRIERDAHVPQFVIENLSKVKRTEWPSGLKRREVGPRWKNWVRPEVKTGAQKKKNEVWKEGEGKNNEKPSEHNGQNT